MPCCHFLYLCEFHLFCFVFFFTVHIAVILAVTKVLFYIYDRHNFFCYLNEQVHLKSRTYLKYTDPWFWEKLFFALPSVEKRLDDDRLDVLQGMRFLARDNTVIHEPNTQNQYLREQRIRLEVIGHNEVN